MKAPIRPTLAPQQLKSKPLQTPVALTVAYEFASFEHCRATYALQVKSHGYSRISNPTVEELENRLRDRSEAVGSVAFASGMAAISNLLFAVAYSGANVVANPQLYGGTIALFQYCETFGIETRWVDFRDYNAVRAAIDDNTVLIFSETISNPGMRMYAYDVIYAIAQEAGVLCAIDNTNLVGLFDALDYCDVEVLSATKYIGGHGTAVGGLLVCGPFEAMPSRYPRLFTKSGDYAQQRAVDINRESPFLTVFRCSLLRNFGAAMSPMNAFLFLNGLETLDLRMGAVSRSAVKMAEWLACSSEVSIVNHPELNADNRDFLKYFAKGTGGLFCFELRRGIAAVPILLDSLRRVKIATNIGDCKTILQHVATTSHGQCDEESLARAGANSSTLRVSTGLEATEELIEDLRNALSICAQHTYPLEVRSARQNVTAPT